ncbi:MerR family transcriptional regulator [Metabacillus herbersteinensis]|uniref:MerR family transcriptional regulator n=1 Tax=Metabacillus herbersteinensis TaxID=283816 RepID=A0ABV6GM42_9BACI
MTTFMKPYRIKEVSRMIDIPEGTLRQWESDFEGILNIPRDEIGRYYTDFEIEILKRIKSMRDKNIPKKMIKELFEAKKQTDDASLTELQPSVPQMQQNEAIETLLSIKEMMANIKEFKDVLKQEIREEVKNEIRKEVIEEVRREIAIGSEAQQRLLESGNKETSEYLGSVSKSLEQMENNYKSELKRRDEVLIENMRLMRELQEKKKKEFLAILEIKQ